MHERRMGWLLYNRSGDLLRGGFLGALARTPLLNISGRVPQGGFPLRRPCCDLIIIGGGTRVGGGLVWPIGCSTPKAFTFVFIHSLNSSREVLTLVEQYVLMLRRRHPVKSIDKQTTHDI